MFLALLLLIPQFVEGPCIEEGESIEPLEVNPLRMLLLVTGIIPDWDTFPTILPERAFQVFAPWPFDSAQIEEPEYQWSFSNFFYYDSFKEWKVAGETNPNWGGYVILIDDYDFGTGHNFDRGRYQDSIFALIDPYVDFSLYDQDQNGIIDPGAITFLMPRYPYGHPSLSTSYQTNDGVVIMQGSGIEIGYSYNIDTIVPNFGYYDKLVEIIAHEEYHRLTIPDRYENRADYDPQTGECTNPGTLSAVNGVYSLINVLSPGPDHPAARPATPYDKIHYPGWIEPIVINQTTYHVPIPDFLSSGIVYKIPLNYGDGHEYFLITNHQKVLPWGRWESAYEGTGLLIWHINENFPDNFWYGNNFHSEKRRRQDVECAIGLYDLTGAWPDSAEPVPEFGWDNLDFWVNWRLLPEPWEWYVETHNGSYSASTDFYKESTKTEFDHLTNPSSDGYGEYKPAIYPAGSYGNYWWQEVAEAGHVQNIASHIAIRNIHRDPYDSTIMIADILVNYVQSDNSVATGLTNGRKLILYQGNLYMVYKSKRYIYFTWQNQDQRWVPAFPIGEGYYPAFSRASSEWCVSWIKDEGEDKVIYFSKGYQYSWSEPTEIYRLSPTQNDTALLSPLSMIVDSDDTVHLVMEAQLSSATSLSWELKYGKFYKDNPSQIVWEILDSYYEPLPSLDLSSPSITLDHDNYPHVT